MSDLQRGTPSRRGTERVFLYQRVLPHYRAPVYRYIDEALVQELVVCYGSGPHGSTLLEESGDQPFRTVVLSNRWFGGKRAVWQSFWKPFRAVGRPAAVIAECSPRILSLFPLLAYCKAKGLPIVLWGHGGSRKRDVASSRHLKDRIHRFLVQAADAFICYTDEDRRRLAAVADPDNLFVARNTLDTPTLFALRRRLEKKGKEAIKDELGLTCPRYLCFIGRLLPAKRVDLLVDVLGLLQRRGEPVGAIIIGDGPCLQPLKSKVERASLDDVHFTGAIAAWETSALYLYIADVLVNPGYVGLSVNHAFCFGTPVITQAATDQGPFHSPEIAYVQEGQTGYKVEKGDVSAMEEAVGHVLARTDAFYRQTVAFAENHLSVDHMVEGFSRALRFALQTNADDLVNR